VGISVLIIALLYVDTYLGAFGGFLQVLFTIASCLPSRVLGGKNCG
jgi:hypothetical protein